MIEIRSISEKQAKDAMSNGEFGREVIASATHVAVILTQDWCGQWIALKHDLRRLEKKGLPEEFDLHVYELMYNLEPYFREFMAFKEIGPSFPWLFYSIIGV